MFNWPWNSKPPTKEQFGRLMLTAIAKASGTSAQEFDPSRFSIFSTAKPSHRLYLDNAYATYCRADRKERITCLEKFAATFVIAESADETESYTVAKPRLLPRVRERSYFASFDLQMRIGHVEKPEGATPRAAFDTFAVRPFGDHLTIEIVQDLPDAIKSVSPSDLAEWNVTFDAAMAVARDNLWAQSNENFVTVRPGLFASPWRDSHDASRLFLHDLLWQLPVAGRHVAAIPNRDVLLVTGDEDDENLTAMATLALGVLDEPRPMTGRLFRLQDRTWLPFTPGPESPASIPVRHAAIKSQAMEYRNQKQLLDDLNKKSGHDQYVASFAARQNPDGAVFSLTYWVDPIDDALMPAADFVAFTRVADGQGNSLGLFEWDRVAAVLRDRMSKTDLYPVRYAVRSFPTAEELAALGESKVSA